MNVNDDDEIIDPYQFELQGSNSDDGLLPDESDNHDHNHDHVKVVNKLDESEGTVSCITEHEEMYQCYKQRISSIGNIMKLMLCIIL